MRNFFAFIISSLLLRREIRKIGNLIKTESFPYNYYGTSKIGIGEIEISYDHSFEGNVWFNNDFYGYQLSTRERNYLWHIINGKIEKAKANKSTEKHNAAKEKIQNALKQISK